MKSSDWATWRLLDEMQVNSLISQGGWFIHGPLTSDRDKYLPAKVPAGNPVASVSYHSDDEAGDQLRIVLDAGRTVLEDPSPVSCASDFARIVAASRGPVLLDITSLPVPAIFLILQAFLEESIDNLYASHVEPSMYNIRSSVSLVPNYQLSDGYSNVRDIPGFFRPARFDLTRTLYVTLGFEGHRFNAVVDYFNNDGEVRPVLPLPSYNAGWHMLAVRGNLLTLDHTKTSRLMRRVCAFNPFQLLAVLENERTKNQDTNQLVVAPIGTKPHALAAAIFTLRHSDVAVVYDHPSPKPTRSSGVASVKGYALSGLLKAEAQ